MDVRRGGLGARLEVRVDVETKRRIGRAAKGCGKSVGDFVRGLCVAGVGRREAEAREWRRGAKALRAAGAVGWDKGRRKKGV